MELNIPPKYRQDIESAANLLKNEGCETVFLFGSLVTGKIRDDSDIDIGVKGLPQGKFLSFGEAAQETGRFFFCLHPPAPQKKAAASRQRLLKRRQSPFSEHIPVE